MLYGILSGTRQQLALRTTTNLRLILWLTERGALALAAILEYRLCEMAGLTSRNQYPPTTIAQQQSGLFYLFKYVKTNNFLCGKRSLAHFQPHKFGIVV